MKKKRKIIQPEMERLMPLIVGEWRRRTKLKGPEDRLQTREFRSSVEVLSILKNAFDQNPSLLGENYLNDPDKLNAYLLYFWPLYYQEALSLLGELPHEPKRCLDIAGGAGSASLALLRHGAEEVILTDASEEALKVGSSLIGREGYTVSTRRWDVLKERSPVEGKFDVITLCHALEELFPEEGEKEIAFVESLIGRLETEGTLLITLGTLPHQNSRLLRLRDRLVKRGFAVQAPCVWQGACPALEGRFPCFAQRTFEKTFLLKEIQRALDIALSSLKVTYLMVRAKGAPFPTLEDPPLWRVVSPPFDSPLGRHLYLCGTEGKRRLVDKSNQHEGFGYLRRGDLIRVKEAKESEKNLTLVEHSTIEVAAAPGKPVA